MQTREEKINEKYGYDTANETIAICDTRSDDRVVEFKSLKYFNGKFISLQQNSLWRGIRMLKPA